MRYFQKPNRDSFCLLMRLCPKLWAFLDGKVVSIFSHTLIPSTLYTLADAFGRGRIEEVCDDEVFAH